MVSASACTAAASARMYATASSYAGMTPGATGGFHSRGLSRLMLGRMGGYFGFLRAGVLRFGGEVETGSELRGLVDASDVVGEPVSGGEDVTLERVSSVELALASGTVTARSRHNVNIADHNNQQRTNKRTRCVHVINRIYTQFSKILITARWPSGPRRVTQAKACLIRSGFSSAYAGRGSNPLLVNFFVSIMHPSTGALLTFIGELYEQE